jgi:putative ABC transport system permease protein
MQALHRAQFGYLWRHPWQLVLAIIGVLAGVAVMVAVDVANQSARTAFLLSMDAVTGEATHQVIGGPRGLDDRVYTSLRVDHGIHSVAPVIEGEVSIGERSFTLLGIDLFAELEMRNYMAGIRRDDAADENYAFREFLTEPGALILTHSAASDLGIALGDRVDVRLSGVGYPARLVATLADDTARGIDHFAMVDIATAQDWLDLDGRLTRIDVRAPADDEAWIARLEGLLPDGAHLLTAAGRTQTTADLSRAFMTNLMAMSLLALLVGLFLIYNSISFSVLQRRGLIGVLRALGVTRRQTILLVLTEAGVIGIVAASLGVLAGVKLGESMLALVSQSINDLYFRVSVADVDIPPLSVAKGLVAGTLAALAAAAVPAIEASSYAPRLAMSRSVIEQRSTSLLPWLVLAGLLLAGAAFVLLAVSGRNLVAGLVSVFLLILGFALLVPPAVRAATGRLAAGARAVAGTIARVAVADIGASLSRTGVAIVALAVAVSATIGVQVMVSSFRASVSDWLDDSLSADVYAGVDRGALESALIDDLAGLDGVAVISTRQRVTLEDETGRTQLLVIGMPARARAGTELLDAKAAEVWPAFDERDAVLVSEPYGYKHDVRRGDELLLTTAAGERAFEVVATFKSYDVNASAVLMSRATYDRNWNDRRVDSLGFYLDEGVDVDDFIARAKAIAEGRQQLLVTSNARIRELSLEIFDRTFRITDLLYWLTLGVAFVGILGAMLALQLERARELATLRALGVTPGQLGAMITTQTGVIGFMSGVAAMPLGVVMAWVLIEVINRRAFGWQIDMRVDPAILLSAVGFAVAAAVVAGLYPALRAARSEPALAMREE